MNAGTPRHACPHETLRLLPRCHHGIRNDDRRTLVTGLRASPSPSASKPFSELLFLGKQPRFTALDFFVRMQYKPSPLLSIKVYKSFRRTSDRDGGYEFRPLEVMAFAFDLCPCLLPGAESLASPGFLPTRQ